MPVKEIQGGELIRWGAKGEVEKLRDHAILIEGAWIKGVYPLGSRPQELPAPDEIFRAEGCAILPGFLNCHQHLFQSLTRAHHPVQNAKLFTWLTTLYNIWAKYGYRELRAAALVSLGEMILHGCTCSTDMQYLFPRNSDLRIDAIFEAAEMLGIRMIAGRGAMTLSKDDGGLPPPHVCETDAEALAGMQDALERFHDRAPGAMQQISLQPCAPFNVSLDLMRESLTLGREHGAILQTHLAETNDETDYCQERYDCRPVALMERLEWLGDDISFAHCVTLNDDEIALFAETGSAVAHCPSANMRLGSGTAPIPAMREAGVTVGIGVDGSSSNDGMSPLAEARLALLAQRTKLVEPDALVVEDGLDMLTRSAAKLLRRPELGNIAVGFAADLAIFDLNTMELAGGATQDALGALMLCRPGRARDVMINGQWTVRESRLVGVDESQLTAEVGALVAERLTQPIPDLAKKYPPIY